MMIIYLEGLVELGYKAHRLIVILLSLARPKQKMKKDVYLRDWVSEEFYLWLTVECRRKKMARSDLLQVMREIYMRYAHTITWISPEERSITP